MPIRRVGVKQEVIQPQPYQEQWAVVKADVVVTGVRPQVRREVVRNVAPIAYSWIVLNLLVIVVDEVKPQDGNMRKQCHPERKPEEKTRRKKIAHSFSRAGRRSHGSNLRRIP